MINLDQNGYYVATIPALKGCHTQAKKLDALLRRVRKVIELCIEAEGRPNTSLEFVGIHQVAV